jgi:hypothetical protein
MTKQTTDYSIFKYFAHNREVVPAHVRKMIKSILTSNFLKDFPIKVDSEMRVVDGQHRIEAARSLGVPVHYDVISIENADEAMLLLNVNQRGWSMTDYLNYYTKRGFKQYLLFQQFIEKHCLAIYEGLDILASPYRKRGSNFREGNYLHPSPEEILLHEEDLEKFHSVLDFILSKQVTAKSYLTSRRFRLALMTFCFSDEIDAEKFIHKLSFNLLKMHPCATYAQYKEMFTQIYEWNDRSKNNKGVCYD